jgi:hypothetical protein
VVAIVRYSSFSLNVSTVYYRLVLSSSRVSFLSVESGWWLMMMALFIHMIMYSLKIAYCH